MLICVGINNYKDMNIGKLAYAVSDAYHIERAYNLHKANSSVCILTDENATHEKIIHAIKNAILNNNEICIYYSSHGDVIDNTTYLYTYDTKISEIKTTSISLKYLINLFCENEKTNVTLILDACNVIVPHIYTKNIKIFYPESFSTYEDTFTKYGNFTRNIIKKLIKNELIVVEEKHAGRYYRIRKEIEKIFYNKNRLIWMHSKVSNGKSHFLRHLNDAEKNTIYISIPKIKALTLNIIFNLISEKILSVLKADKFNYIDPDPERYIRIFFNMHNFYLLIIDHIDNLASKHIKKLCEFISELNIHVILASKNCRTITTAHTYKLPSLSNEDIIEILNNNEIFEIDIKNIPKCESYFDVLKYINQINANHNNIENLDVYGKKIIAAIAITGGFINKDLFIAIFGLKKSIINKFINNGLIIKHENFYYPHDIIYDKALYIKPLVNKKKAYFYWEEEVKKNPESIKAIHNLILSYHSLSPKITINDDIYYYIVAKLNGRQNSHFIILLYDKLKNKKLSMNLRLKLAESLIDIGKFNEAGKIIGKYTKHKNIDLLILYSELLWWKGKFTKCIDTAVKLLPKHMTVHQNVKLYCSIGIGHFFLGKWITAAGYFELIIKENKSIDDKTLFFSYAVLATIQGLRGEKINESINNFITAIEIAKSTKKISWLSLLYGNIGEMLWKAGKYRKAIDILSAASHLAYLTGNDAVNLEIKRNLLHAYHRYNKFENENNLIIELDKEFIEDIDSYVKMQIINTLITHYIFSENNKYKYFLNKAIKLTEGNDEYHIYTMANLAIASLYEQKKIKAIKYMNQALKLCYAGKNWLAIKQIFEDWDEIVKRFHPHFLLTKQAFPKWHQILERELLEQLHHFSRLCEYLQ